MLKLAGLLVAAALAASPALAEPEPVSGMPLPQNCAHPEMRQLDFWVGDWEVFNTADNVKYAESRIEKIYGGCAIRETYQAPKSPGGAYGGTSYSSFDRRDGKWHQFYVDTNGNATWYSGGMEGPDMVLFAPGAKPGAEQRMTYRPNADGSVRQIGVISTDGRKTWQAGYDYTYRRK